MVFREPSKLFPSQYPGIPDGFSHLIVDRHEVFQDVLEFGKRRVTEPSAATEKI